jgi:hypothetical protein
MRIMSSAPDYLICHLIVPSRTFRGFEGFLKTNVNVVLTEDVIDTSKVVPLKSLSKIWY